MRQAQAAQRPLSSPYGPQRSCVDELVQVAKLPAAHIPDPPCEISTSARMPSPIPSGPAIDVLLPITFSR